jgi:hypothetical protein
MSSIQQNPLISATYKKQNANKSTISALNLVGSFVKKSKKNQEKLAL